jgi:hypothetical protein
MEYPPYLLRADERESRAFPTFVRAYVLCCRVDEDKHESRRISLAVTKDRRKRIRREVRLIDIVNIDPQVIQRLDFGQHGQNQSLLLLLEYQYVELFLALMDRELGP